MDVKMGGAKGTPLPWTWSFVFMIILMRITRPETATPWLCCMQPFKQLACSFGHLWLPVVLMRSVTSTDRAVNDNTQLGGPSLLLPHRWCGAKGLGKKSCTVVPVVWAKVPVWSVCCWCSRRRSKELGRHKHYLHINFKHIKSAKSIGQQFKKIPFSQSEASRWSV